MSAPRTTTSRRRASTARSAKRSGRAGGGRSGGGRRRTAPPWRRRLRLSLLVAALLAIVVAGWLLWPFWQLTAQLGAATAKLPSRLYGRSAVLRSGMPSSAQRLATTLGRLGYRRVAESGGLRPGTFHSTKGRLEARLRTFPTPQGPSGGGLLRVDFAGGAIDALALDRREVDMARLDPPLVTSYYGPDLRERRPCGLDDLPEDLILAVLAIEDDSFLQHSGVSLSGIVRAAWANLRQRGVRQGGSTLTQQLVKNLYLTHERTWVRKLREAILAILLELRYEKRDILETYLNEIFWGRAERVNLMGIGAASWAYFGKEPAQLSLAESALLAGMIHAPAHYAPNRHPARAQARRDLVLARLAELRWVEPSRLERARAAPIEVAETPAIGRHAAFFADLIEIEARRRFGISGLDDGGYTLFSTLDAADQKWAEEAVRWGVEALETGWEKGQKRAQPLEAALLSIDPRDGGILAYVGGRDYGRSQFDRISMARRQPGSAFKPVVYAAAYEARLATPATFLEDAPLTVRQADQTWQPANSDGKYRGWVSTRTALEKSLNVPTARLALEVGLTPIIALARDMGIESRIEAFPSLALGSMEVTPWELATVYGTLASGGARPALHGLIAVRDREGQSVTGEVVPPPQRVLAPEVAYLVNKVLEGVLDRGTARGARDQGLADRLAGKTGTTNSRRDSWFAGYGPQRATLVWVGYDDNARTRLSGARAAVPIWARFTHKVRPPGGYPTFTQPAGVVAALIDPTTGGLATDRCGEVETGYFLRDFLPSTLCPEHGGWRALPLDQPDEIEIDEGHPFRRWLRMLRRKNKDRRDGG